jgi:hypothetical protein
MKQAPTVTTTTTTTTIFVINCKSQSFRPVLIFWLDELILLSLEGQLLALLPLQ